MGYGEQVGTDVSTEGGPDTAKGQRHPSLWEKWLWFLDYVLLVLWIGLCLWAQRHSDEELATSWGLSRPLSPRHPPQEPVSAPSPCSNKARRPAFREGSGCLCPGRPWWFTWQGPGAQRLRTQVSELTGHGDAGTGPAVSEANTVHLLLFTLVSWDLGDGQSLPKSTPAHSSQFSQH